VKAHNGRGRLARGCLIACLLNSQLRVVKMRVLVSKWGGGWKGGVAGGLAVSILQGAGAGTPNRLLVRQKGRTCMQLSLCMNPSGINHRPSGVAGERGDQAQGEAGAVNGVAGARACERFLICFMRLKCCSTVQRPIISSADSAIFPLQRAIGLCGTQNMGATWVPQGPPDERGTAAAGGSTAQARRGTHAMHGAAEAGRPRSMRRCSRPCLLWLHACLVTL
jgi:hypothetical protein